MKLVVFALITLLNLNLAPLCRAQSIELKFDTSIDPTLKASIQNDLSFMTQIRFTKTTPLHDAIFGKAHYLAWFQSRIFEIGIDPNETSPSALGYVDPIKSSKNKMWLTPFYLATSLPLMCRVGNFLHEARHSEQENWYWHHWYCPVPFKNREGKDVRGYYSQRLFEGKLACDRYAEGAYGLEVVMYDNVIRNCDTCNEKLKADAQIYRDDLIDRVIIDEAYDQLKNDQY